MREFNDKDRKKKGGRITLPQNPGNLPPDKLLMLETAVKAAVVAGHIPCPAAWRIAADNGVSKLDVGVMIDRLGIRIINCQLGCFKFEKTAHTGDPIAPPPAELAAQVTALAAAEDLTCTNIFLLAQKSEVPPRAVADTANALGQKIRRCQLGCF